MNPDRWLTIMLLGAGLGAGEPVPVESAKPAPPATEPAKPPEVESKRKLFEFDPSHFINNRPDIFDAHADRLRIARQIAELNRAAKTEMITKTGQVVAPTIDSRADAERQVQRFLNEIRDVFLAEDWTRALQIATKYEEDATRLQTKYPGPVIDQALTMIGHYKIQAQEKVIFEEAKAKFRALGLKVEGILWSASQPSLAIIKGEPVARGVNERVKDCRIANIDVNRVDFVFHLKERQRHFDFQLYIGEEF